MGSRRNNTFTRWIGDMVDDTKELVDDILDRGGEVEKAVTDTSPITSELATLASAIEELTANVNRLAQLQSAAAANAAAAAPDGALPAAPPAVAPAARTAPAATRATAPVAKASTPAKKKAASATKPSAKHK
jgi:ABC-type transporter Mla subunit MlaD